MENCFDPSARKKPTNLSVNSDLLRQAKELGINMSQIFEERLAEVIRERKRLKWQEENKAGLDAYGRFLEENGLFSDSVRRF
jgi:antitoxin CcdA